MDIRMATPEDAPALLEIYAPYIKDTAVSFDIRVPSKSDFIRRMQRIIGRFPYLVAENNGRVVGYAYAHPESERSAYQWNAELSIYMNRDFQSSALASRLYNALIEFLGLLGYRNLYAVITLPDEANISRHKHLGFTPLAVHKNAGYKLGKWHDVAWLEKSLGPYRANPEPPLAMSGLAPELVRSVLEKA